MNKKILLIQAILILLPVSIISLWGGSALLLILVGDKLDSNTMTIASFFIAVIILSFLGLASLWVEIINRMFYARTLLHKRLVSIPVHIGAIIAVLSILSLISMLVVPETKNTIGALGLFAYGAPALLPYFYVIWTKNANTSIKSDS